jgi:ABC-type phosphate transport system permease subunit
MKTTLFYGLILAASNVVVTLVGFFLGFQTEKIVEGRWFSFVPLVVCIVVTWLGITAVREETTDKSLSYGKGVASGVLINLYSGIVGAVYGFIHFTFINPNFRDYLANASRQQWAEKGISDAQMDAMEKGMRFMTSPAVSSIFGLVVTVFIGLLVALVVSVFLKRVPQPEFKQTAPVA